MFVTLRAYPGRDNISAIRLLSLVEEVLVPTDLHEVIKMQLLFDDGTVIDSSIATNVFVWNFEQDAQGTITTSNLEEGTYIWGDLNNIEDYEEIDINSLLRIRVAQAPDVFESCKVVAKLGEQPGPPITWRVQFALGTSAQVTDEFFTISSAEDTGKVELYLGRASVAIDGAAMACLVVYPSAYSSGITWGNLRVIYGGCGVS
jgi:hypothetical protein